MNFVLKDLYSDNYLAGERREEYGRDRLRWTTDINEAMVFKAVWDSEKGTFAVEPEPPYESKWEKLTAVAVRLGSVTEV